MASRHGFYRRRGKRLLDLALVVPGLLLLAVPMLLVAAAVRLKLGRPVLFRQTRPGLGGKPFVMLKFRTMADLRDGTGNPLPDAERLPPFGRMLRRTSLDELPELFNVLTGEMSLVGPRPLLMQYLARYDREQARRHEAPPGVTGWAQVNGRNAISWEAKFAHDVWYVDHLSALLDLRILFTTLARVLAREGIAAEGEATMPEFTGSKPVGGGEDR